MYLQMKVVQCENQLFHGEILLVNNVDFSHNSQKKKTLVQNYKYFSLL